MSELKKFVCGEYEIPVIIDARAPKNGVILTPALLAAVVKRMKEQPSRPDLRVTAAREASKSREG